MESKKISIPYKSISYVINVNTIKLFKDYETRRIPRKAVVGRLKQQLMEGIHFQSPIVVNKSNGDYKIIDGHHRIDAIRNFFDFSKTNRQKNIEVNLAVYDNLEEEEEKKMYHLWNIGTPETADDLLKFHENEMEFLKLLRRDDFPCDITFYGTKKSLKFRTILYTLKTIRVSTDSFNPQNIHKESVVEFANSLLYQDYLDLRQFLFFFKKVFGDIEGGNIFIKKSLFIPVADIYYKNKDNFPEKTLMSLFKSISGKQQIMTDALLQGKEAILLARKHMLEYMNVGRSKHLVV